jgi:hypothetical protein
MSPLASSLAPPRVLLDTAPFLSLLTVAMLLDVMLIGAIDLLSTFTIGATGKLFTPDWPAWAIGKADLCRVAIARAPKKINRYSFQVERLVANVRLGCIPEDRLAGTSVLSLNPRNPFVLLDAILNLFTPSYFKRCAFTEEGIINLRGARALLWDTKIETKWIWGSR